MNILLGVVIQIAVVFGVVAWNYFDKYNNQLSIMANYDAGMSARNLHQMCEIARRTYDYKYANNLVYYEIDCLIKKCHDSLHDNLVRSEIKAYLSKSLNDAIALYQNMPYLLPLEISQDFVKAHRTAQDIIDNKVVPNQSLHQSP